MQICCCIHSIILNVTATQYTCSLNNVYCPHCLVQWCHNCSHMNIPVYSPWLPGYINVIQTIVVILTMAGLFLDRPCLSKFFCNFKKSRCYFLPYRLNTRTTHVAVYCSWKNKRKKRRLGQWWVSHLLICVMQLNDNFFHSIVKLFQKNRTMKASIRWDLYLVLVQIPILCSVILGNLSSGLSSTHLQFTCI